MLELYSIISGSSGNCSLVTDGKTVIIVDCGTSGKRVFAELAKISVTPDMLSAIVVTHEHSDHTKGVGVLARKLKIPVYTTSGTHRFMEIGSVEEEQRKIVKPDIEYCIGDIAFTPFSIPHDAADPCGYIFSDGHAKAAVATDMGYMPNSLFSRLAGVKSIILESNHDIDMLRMGDYPFPLKQRILSDIGHLSNEIAADTALKLVETGTEHIMLGHLSEHNNLPEIAQMETFNRLCDNGVRVGIDMTLQVADRYTVTGFNSRKGFS